MGPCAASWKSRIAGIRLGHHEVARHPVAVHRDLRLRQRRGDQRVADLLPGLAVALAPRDAVLARHAPVGEQLQLAPQHRLVVRRQRIAGHAQLPLHEGGDGVAHQLVGLRCRGRGQRVQVQLLPEVVEQQEALPFVGGQDLWPVQAGGRDQAGDPDERPHVLLRRRRVHHNPARSAVGVDAQVATKAGVGRGGAQRGRLQAVVADQRRQPLLEGRLALRVGPGDGGGRGGGGHG